MLKLATVDGVVQPMPEASSFDAAWACRTGQMKTRGDGRDKTRKLWVKAEKKVGCARLLEALKRYLREKEPTCGFCGLSVWLNGEKYDHWLEAPGSPDTVPRQSAPPALRQRLESVLEETFLRSYLDPCAFHEDGYITPATDFARKKLLEKASILKAAGLAGIRRK